SYRHSSVSSADGPGWYRRSRSTDGTTTFLVASDRALVLPGMHLPRYFHDVPTTRLLSRVGQRPGGGTNSVGPGSVGGFLAAVLGADARSLARDPEAGPNRHAVPQRRSREGAGCAAL